jgi:hypothetical protein
LFLVATDTGKYMSVSKHGLVAADKQAPKSNKERWRLTRSGRFPLFHQRAHTHTHTTTATALNQHARRASNLFNICSLSGDYLYFGLRGEVRSTSGAS